jgi:serine/threonine-protein kinase
VNPEELQRVGRWPIRRMIGQGGFSWVFEVADENLFNVRRALKMLKPEAAQGEGLMRFLREVEILSPLDDPHLVRIYEHGTDPATGNRYYVMEFLTGSDLQKLLRESRAGLPAERVVSIFEGVLAGLSRIHAQQPPVIHRDIKPPNIQITESGVKLIDFGIARRSQDSDVTVVGDADITQLSTFIGTVKYSSPEQLRAKGLRPPSDVFSLGICLYEALEGRHPYEDLPDLPTQSYQDVLGYYVQLEATRAPLALKFRKTPRALQAVIRRALAIKPDDRFRDAAEMRSALLQASGGRGPVDVAAPGRSPLWIAGGVAAALLAALAVGYALTRPPSPGTAQTEQAQPAAPGASELASRTAAQGLVAELDRRREAIPAEQDRDFRARLARADSTWQGGAFAEAARQYDQAYSFGKQLLALHAPAAGNRAPVLERVEPAGPLTLALGESREIEARASDADSSDVSTEFLVTDPQGSFTRTPGPRLRFAPRTAGAWAIEVLARDGAGAESEPVRIAASVTPASAAPVVAAPRLTVFPVGPLSLAPGERTEFTAKLSPDDPGATFAYTLVLPSGERQVSTGGRYAFSPAAPGKYTIEVVGTNARGERSGVRRIAATVRPPLAPNRPPLLRAPQGTIELSFGETRVLHATASDPDGDPIEIEYAVTEPNGIVRRSKGPDYSLTASVKGTYAVEVTASDGKTIRRQTFEAVVTSAFATADDEGTQLLADYAEALEAMDLQRLRAVYRMDAETENGMRGLFGSVEQLFVVATPLGRVQASGQQGKLRFKQRIAGKTADGRTAEFVNGTATADLVKRPDGWQIVRIVSE